MDKPRITETDIRIIDEWLTEVAKDTSMAFISHTSDETRIIAMMLKQLLKEQETEIRQLKLALDIAKGTCKGIAVKGR